MRCEPVHLEGAKVSLIPLQMDHVDALWEAAKHPELWEAALSRLDSPEDVEAYVREALDLQNGGSAVPFSIVVKESGRIVGSTRFGNIEPAHKRVEIGWTWIVPAYQRSFVNTQAKFLMLSHAFEVWGCNRVEFKTDFKNMQSRNALQRIGAKEEGVMRRHMVRANGVIRDSVYYSIIAEEWPDAKERLQRMMER